MLWAKVYGEPHQGCNSSERLDNVARRLDSTDAVIYLGNGLIVNRSPTLENTPAAEAPPAAPLNYTTPAPEKAGRFHQLDGLRALAASIVVIHHSLSGAVATFLRESAIVRAPANSDPTRHPFWYVADLLSHITGSGVELFFVLSGIVLLRPYLRGQRRFDVASYFKRRAQRLWPPYLVALFFDGLFLWAMSRWPTWYSTARLHLEHVQFSFTGWASQLGILNLGWDMYNVAWWSLTVELIFYAVAPLLVPVFASRLMTRLIFIGVMLLAFAGGAWLTLSFGDPVAHGAENHGSLQAVLNFGFYLPCFLFGLALAKYDVPKRVAAALIPAGVAWAVVANFQDYQWLNVHAGFALLYAGLTILAFDVGGRWMRFLSSRFMVWLGERSYSLFLIHFTVFAAANWACSFLFQKGDAYFLATRLIGIPGALLSAMLLFWFVERRFARNLVTDKHFWPVW
jgi:peptidoglycan/LPS O-acetylase OafA/YrhL